MNKNINSILTIIVFLGLLVFPSVIYPFVKEKLDNTNYENRVLTNWDLVKNSSLENFSENFEQYYNDHLPFKNELQKLRAAIKYKIFHTPSSNKVIIGENDWFFYGSKEDGITDEVGDFQKNTKFTSEEKDLIYNNLIAVKEKLLKNKIDFYLFIPNNKTSIYSDYIPSVYHIKENALSKTEDLIEEIKDQISIVYPKETLINYRNIAETYYQYDTHWNNFGATIGTLELIKAIEGDEYDLNDLTIKNELSHIGDLSRMNQTLSFVNNYEPNIYGFYENIIPICTSTEDVINCLADDAKYDKKILLVGDSFRSAMVPILNKLYKNTIVVYVPYFNYTYIDKYKPDIVVYEVVERNTHQLLTIKNYF